MNTEELKQHLAEKLGIAPESLQPGTLRRTMSVEYGRWGYTFKFNLIPQCIKPNDIMLGERQLMVVTGIELAASRAIKGKFYMRTGIHITNGFPIQAGKSLTFQPRPVFHGMFDQCILLDLKKVFNGPITIELTGLAVMDYDMREAGRKLWYGQLEASQPAKINVLHHAR